MSSPASGVAAQAPSSATAHFWGMHAGVLALPNTQTHLAGDQNAESKMGHIAATIFVAGVASSHGNSSKGSSRSSSSCNSGRGQLQQEWEQHHRQQWLSVGSVVAQLG